MKLYFGVAFILLIVSCSKKTVATVVKKEEPLVVEKTVIAPPPTAIVETPKPETPPLSIPPNVDSNLLFSLQRTSCFGQCPAFKVEVFNTGKAIYNGIAYVKKPNKYETVVPTDIIKQIEKKALESRYLDWANKYPVYNAEISDIPSTISYIRLGNTGKMIVNNYDAPKELIEFERWVEKLLDGLDWQEIK